MKALAQEEFERMVRVGEVLAQDDDMGIRVLRLPDETYLKLFRKKAFPSSAAFISYATRFHRNANRLLSMGVQTVKVVESFKIEGQGREAVQYHGLKGDTLRNILNSVDTLPDRREKLIIKLTKYMAWLHGKGVFFRSIHFDNVFVLPDDSLGLIDVTSTKFYRRGVPIVSRARNFKPPFRYESDKAALMSFGLRRFVDRYLEAAKLKPVEIPRFLRALASQQAELHAAIELFSEIPEARVLR